MIRIYENGMPFAHNDCERLIESSDVMGRVAAQRFIWMAQTG